MVLGIDPTRAVANGIAMGAGQKLVVGGSVKECAKKGVAMSAATVGSELSFRFLPIHGHLGPLEQYGTDLLSSAFYAAIEAFYLNPSDKSLKKFLMDAMIAMGANVVGGYAEAPLWPYIPSFLK